MAERAQREMQKGGRARHLVEESGAHEAVRRPSQRVAVLHQTKRPVAIEKRDPLLRLQLAGLRLIRRIVDDKEALRKACCSGGAAGSRWRTYGGATPRGAALATTHAKSTTTSA